MTSIAGDLAKCLAGVTKEYTKQRKAEERNSRAYYRREYMYSDRVKFTDVADQILPGAYCMASGDGKYPASKRQVYYAAREAFRRATGRELTQQRCNTLLLQHMNQNPEATASWRVTADPRGTLYIPNSHEETRIPCGTLDIDGHLAAVRDDEPLNAERKVPWQWPTLAAGQRFRAVLYIEKEGFEPLLRQARIAERFEIAVLSCKGQSVVAARKYVDHVCHVNGGVPLFVVHDFDVYGFFIGARLTSVSWQAEMQDRVAYRFQHKIAVTDFGLRLDDVSKYALAHETCKPPPGIERGLGCTQEERQYLLSGRRVELNAFTAPQFVEWLEGKLRGAGIADRMVPDEDVLERAYRRCVVTVRVNDAVRKMHSTAVAEASAAKVPRRLATKIRKAISQQDEPWDIALHRLVAKDLGVELPQDDDGQGDDVVAMAERLDIKDEVLKRGREFAKYTDAEFTQAMKQLAGEREEMTSDDVLKRLRRNRRARGDR